MKPFNLESAKRGAPVIQRCGRPARILAFGSKVGCLGIKYPLVVEFLNGSGEFEINSFTEDGEITPTIPSDVDLFMAPRKEKRWIVSFLTKAGTLLAIGCNSRDEMTLRKSNCENEGVACPQCGQDGFDPEKAFEFGKYESIRLHCPKCSTDFRCDRESVYKVTKL